MLQMIEMVSVLLLLFHVNVSSHVLARLCSMLRMTLWQMKHTRLILLRGSLWGTVAICGPSDRGHERVCGEEGASTFWVNPRHDGCRCWRQLSHHHLAVVWCFHIHMSHS